MKKNYFLFIVFFLLSCSGLRAQSANWGAVLPALFPTNASGQIHGISRVSQMKFHPTSSSKLYAVSARGGLFISTNGGTSWTVAPGTDQMPYSAFASVCIDFTNDQIIYLGAGDHNYYSTMSGATGVWKSIDGGLTFTQTTLNNKIIVEMVMDPTDHNIIVAVTNGGVYKTTNAGSNWTLKTASRAFDDLKQKTPTSRTLYAATRDSAFFRSADFGDTWSQINSGIILPAGVTNGNGCRVAVTPADTNVVYLAMVANSGLIYKSTDGGTSFTAMKTTVPPYLTYYENVSTSSGQGDYNFGIGVDRVNANILYLVAHNLWKSTDGGANWTQLTNWWQEVHTDMHQIITSPYNNNQLWNMNDGGVWISTDAGSNWNPKSDGLYGYEIYHGTCSPTRRDVMSIGTQDNGELYANSVGWFTNRGGDWQSHCVFDYRANSSMVYYFDPDWGTIHQPKRRLVNGSDANYGLPAAVTDFTDICFNRSNSGLAFIADTAIFRTTNLTVTTPSWTEITNLNKKIMALHSSFADANRLYAITSDGFIYVSTNALSGTPTFTSYALPNSTNNAASITSIKSSPNTIYITCNTRVYRSIDNGANWTNITFNLPSVNHVRVLADEYYSSNELVLITSNNAVYYKTTNASGWTIYNTNLPSRTSIVDMSIFNDSTSNTLLRVATYGRGMWETPIFNLHTLTANLVADVTNVCPGATVQFSDASTGNVTSRSWSFPGGTPASSTAINPAVVYNSAGLYNVSLTVSDGITNNTVTKTNYIAVATGGNLPLAEGFEGITDPPAGWQNIDNGTPDDAWEKTTTAGGYGNSASSMMFNNYSWNIPGEKDELLAKRLDFSGYNSIQLAFDVAYQVYTGFSDSLIVLVSTDCGVTYSRVYAKGGSTLSTAGSSSSSFTPTAAQWRTETVSLNSYIGQPGVIVAFQNINGFGNKLYIDNVNINATIAVNAGNDNTICAGSSVAIGMSPASGINYSWTPATGLSSASISNPTASPVVTTTYILTATHAASGILNRDTVVITVNPSPLVSVSIAAVPTGAICSGTSVTFTATPVNGGTTPAYQWKKNGIVVGATNSYSSSTLVNGDQITCMLTSNLTCKTGSPATSQPITMTVNANVTASVSIVASPSGPICSGTGVTFTANPVNGGTSPVYQWKKNGTNVGSNNATYSDTSLADNDQVVCVMTSNNPCVPVGPVTSTPLSITVNQNEITSVSISASPPGAICSGTSVTFTAQPVNGGMSPVYQWKKNGINAGTNNVSYTDNFLSNNDQVTCVMTSSVACTNPASSPAIVMTVNSAATTSISISASPAGAICSGNNVTFTATPVNGGTAPAYQWKKNGANVGTNSATYDDNLLLNADQVTCVMTSNSLCATGPATSSAITMSVIPTVPTSVNISASPSGTICSGTNVTFTATPTSGGATPSYQWKKNGINTGTNSNGYSDNALANGDQVTCVMTSSIACAVPVTGAVSSPINMSVNPSPVVSVSIAAVPPGPICTGTSVIFTATPVNGGTTPAYQWKKNGTVVGATNTYTTNALVNGDQITCRLASNLTCKTGSPATSPALTMTVNPTVSTGVSIIAEPDEPVCSGTNITFTATPFNGGIAPSYQWKKNAANVGTNSSIYSDTTLVNGNLVTCVMTSNLLCPTPPGGAVSNTISANINACTVTINLKTWIEQFVIAGEDSMRAIADPINYPTICDTLTLQLADSADLQIVATDIQVINTHGLGTFNFSGLIPGHRYYLVIRHRNSIEVWTKNSIYFVSSPFNFDFTRR